MTPLVTLPHEPTCAWPCFDAEDEAAVLAVLRDGNVTTHPIIRALEQDYAAFTGRRHGLAHANGTTALMASFFALGLEPGDEVLVPTATFWASVLPMLWFGLVSVFCESEPDRLGPCPADMRRRVTPRTRAMVVVHLWGLPARMTELQRLARDHGLRIVEDASHAHGATWHDVPCGRLGDISVFSLQCDKLAPAGEGGMLLTDDRDLYDRAVCLGDITRIVELDTPARRFAATSFGVKTRMAPLSAALKRFSNRPCTTWGGRGTSARTDAGGPMRAYSMDLRERALLDSDAGMTAADVAAKYRVSGSWVRLLKQRRRDTGEVAPRVQRHGRRCMLEPHLHTLAALIAAQPDRTLAELKDALATPASVPTVWRAVRALGLTVNKNGPPVRTRSA